MGDPKPSQPVQKPMPLSYQPVRPSVPVTSWAKVITFIFSGILLVAGLCVAIAGLASAFDLGIGCAAIALPVAGALIAIAVIVFRGAMD